MIAARDFASWVDDIGKDHAGATEDIVFEGDSCVDAYIVLDFAAMPDGDTWGDDDILSDVDFGSDRAVGHDVGVVPDA